MHFACSQPGPRVPITYRPPTQVSYPHLKHCLQDKITSVNGCKILRKRDTAQNNVEILKLFIEMVSPWCK